MPNSENNSEIVHRPDYLGGGQWNLIGLNRINVILGINGSGKSILLRALRDLSPENSHYIVPERTGEIQFDSGLLSETDSSRGRKRLSELNYFINYRQAAITRIQAYYTIRGSKKVTEIQHDPEDLMKFTSILLPDFTVGLTTNNPYYELKRIKDNNPVRSVNELSSGESQLLTLGLDILTIVGIWQLEDNGNRRLLIDEPDAHIHPDLQIKFADFLNTISIKYNVTVIVATHSTSLLTALGQFGKDDLSIFYLRPDHNELRGKKYNSICKEVASFLGGHLIMGHLFAAPILLVEGDDDYRIWVHVARSGTVDICVLPCNGDEIKKYRRTLESLLSALTDNTELRGVALLDGDKSTPQPAQKSSLNPVPFVQLNCHESENLYLTDNLLSELNHDWATAVKKIQDESANYGNKHCELSRINEIDRRNGDLKNIINEIADILDDKKLHWTVRVGKYLGKNKPTGMLRDFLGNELISFLWEDIPSPLHHK